MERRALERKTVNVRVYVAFPGRPPMRCTASDISGRGVFLKANPLYLPRNRRLTLMFALHLKASRVVQLRRVPAMVTRSGMDGVGMVFCNTDNVSMSL